MARCPSCDFPLPEDRERMGARCPHCRDPLYEPPGRTGRPAREGEGECTAHPGSEAVGTCGRCGNFLCEVCRTRWRDMILCAACVDRSLQSLEATPEQTRAHFRQAILSLVFGIVAWVLTVLVFVLVVVVVKDRPSALVGMTLLLMLGWAFDTLLAALGLGQATAALRTRGNHMILATLGLIVSGLHIGVIVGLFTFSVWQA